jgi:hypothetical protein
MEAASGHGSNNEHPARYSNRRQPVRRQRLSRQARQSLLRLEIRRRWLGREIEKVDVYLSSIKGHVRSQLARVAELERTGAEIADALDFLDTLEACQREHELYRLRLGRELEAS